MCHPSSENIEHPIGSGHQASIFHQNIMSSCPIQSMVQYMCLLFVALDIWWNCNHQAQINNLRLSPGVFSNKNSHCWRFTLTPLLHCCSRGYQLLEEELCVWNFQSYPIRDSQLQRVKVPLGRFLWWFRLVIYHSKHICWIQNPSNTWSFS